MTKHQANTDESLAVRLDKWLWAARFYKTRTIARDMIKGGKVSYNGNKAKSSKVVEPGATIKLTRGYNEITVTIKLVSDQRRGAPEAQLMYEETAESIKKREDEALARKTNALLSPRPDSRPDKKQRRQIVNFKNQQL